MPTIEERLSGLSGGRILDVATEGGWFIDRMTKALGEFEEVIGVDITDEEFEKARERLNDARISFVVMDGAHLEYPDHSFDMVSMSAGMHHLTDIDAVLSEMVRVLKPGGRFVLREMYRDDPDEKHVTDVMQSDWDARIDRLLGEPHFSTLTRREIIAHVERLGLKQITTDKRECDDCPRSKGETVDQEVTEMDEQLAKVKDRPEYEELKVEYAKIVDRIRTIGVACSPFVDIVGVK
jgi:ubiquinone/menaquinone biosynthesis C-methylase UbiE